MHLFSDDPKIAFIINKQMITNQNNIKVFKKRKLSMDQSLVGYSQFCLNIL